MVEHKKASFQERLQDLVDQGIITQEKADQRLESEKPFGFGGPGFHGFRNSVRQRSIN